nr:hypothetical protein [Tanacetum cinerariifolium]
TLFRPEEAVPFGRPYRTRPNGPHRLLTARKRVGPIPARRLARRCVSSRSLDHHSSSSSPSSRSAPVHSSGFVASDQAHSGPSTRVVSPRLDYPPSSSEDSLERPRHSSSLSARPSRKRCRPSSDSVPSSTPVTGSLAPTRADLLPPRKRYRDSYSPKTSMEEDIEIDTTETEDGRALAIVDGDDVRDQVKVEPRDDREGFKASVGDMVVLRLIRDGTVMSVEDMLVDLDDAIRDFYHHMSEVRVDRIVRIETTQRQLEADQMIASGERASMAKSIRSLRSENLKVHALLCIERDRVDNLRLHMSRSQEEFRQICDDRDDL